MSKHYVFCRPDAEYGNTLSILLLAILRIERIVFQSLLQVWSHKAVLNCRCHCLVDL